MPLHNRICWLLTFLLLSCSNTKTRKSDAEQILMLEFKKPVAKNMQEFWRLSGRQVYCSGNNKYIWVGPTEFFETFRLDIRRDCVEGAGNSTTTPQCSYSIVDYSRLHKGFKRLVKRMWFQNDPKFEATTKPKFCR